MGSPKNQPESESGSDHRNGAAHKMDNSPTGADTNKTEESRPPAGDNPASSRPKRRGRFLPLSRKKTVSPPEDPEGKSDPPDEVVVAESTSHDLGTIDSIDASQGNTDTDSGSATQSEDEEGRSTSTSTLEAALPNGSSIIVTLIVDNNAFDKSVDDTYIGQDGNLFYCHVCKEGGEIICCDGCPRAFHQRCIPKSHPSRQALDKDEEPWYCPVCMGLEMEAEAEADGGDLGRRAVKRICTECQQRGESPLEPCEGCGVYLHHPSCQKDADDSEDDDSNEPVLCSTCQAEEVVHQAEDELEDDSSQEKSRRASRRASIDTTSTMDDDEYEDDFLDEDGKPLLKRKRSGTESEEPSKKKGSQLSVMAKKERRKLRARLKKEERRKKRKQKRERSKSTESYAEHGSPIDDEDDGMPTPSHLSVATGMVQAPPAFFFFLNEYRFKIERALSRKHRYFNRLPKGMERNELISREGALWWVKLRPSDHRRYMNMSMRDFEERVIEWKEEKSIREMVPGNAQPADEEHDELLQSETLDHSRDSAPKDEMLIYQNHQRLYLETSVGSKPFVPDPGKSNNRVLLELLQDMRFHPLPMLSPIRDWGDREPGAMDYAKMTIPHYEVHGPVATSVGDECLGCVRGWNHFCPVLKRRLPPVEYRARLQPPLSSLMATRVGLGLRPRVPLDTLDEIESERDWRNAMPFSKRDTREAIEARRLPPIASYSLVHPSDRADDIVHFVEEAMAMKVPEPPRPEAPSASAARSKRSLLSRGALPIHGRKKREANGGELNKCGRCRAVIQTDTGCVQCRRAQLVINMSKQHHKGLIKVQTSTLGRLSAKDSNFEKLPEGDKAVSDKMLVSRWTPNAVLPPRKTVAPEYHPSAGDDSESEADSVIEVSSGDEEGVALSMMDLVTGMSSSMESSGDVAMKVSPNKQDLGVADTSIKKTTSNDSNVNGDTVEVRSSKRQRTTRRTAAVSATTTSSASDTGQQQIAQEHQAEEAQLNKRCLSVASCGILLALLRRDPLLLFAEPVPDSVEAYSKIVTSPIDFGKIKTKVLNDEYTSLGAFVSDARLLCKNAMAYNPPGTIYSKTAKELNDVLEVMQKRASDWMLPIKNAHASSFAWRGPESGGDRLRFDGDDNKDENDPFKELRLSWPEAVQILESGDWLRSQIASDFVRTKENETAYYASIAVRRAAEAAGASLAAYPDCGGTYNPVMRRSHVEDEALRAAIDKRVAEVSNPPQLKDIPTWREEAILRMLRRVQHRRVEGRISSQNGCARCDCVRIEQEAKIAMRAESVRWGRNKRRGQADTMPRIAASRLSLSTGLGSTNTRDDIEKRKDEAKDSTEVADCIGEVGVSVRGSRVHGWGLFADQPFKVGDIVAEYVGEYISHAVADVREKLYQEQRIQDYQFRADELVIDATMKGGHGRYINHSCNPNCIAKIIEGKLPNRHLKRVIITAQRNIKAREEITYDYQFPLELDLDARIPCNCGEEHCRGFMNWDLPEKGAKNRAQRDTKRGGNMRDRIRRLGKPRKR